MCSDQSSNTLKSADDILTTECCSVQGDWGEVAQSFFNSTLKPGKVPKKCSVLVLSRIRRGSG